MIESSSICFQPSSWGDFLCKLINRLEQGTDGMLAGAPGSRPHGMLFHWPIYTIIDRPYRLQSSDNTERFYWIKINCSVKTTVMLPRMLLLSQTILKQRIYVLYAVCCSNLTDADRFHRLSFNCLSNNIDRMKLLRKKPYDSGLYGTAASTGEEILFLF
jgi:hypothetical protein